MFDSSIKPSPWYYALAALIIIAGTAMSFQLLMSGLGSITEGLTQVIVPGESSLDLPAAGEYTIFYESLSAAEGRIYSTGDDISGLEIRIINKTEGFLVPTYPPFSQMSYDLGGRSGQSVLAFQIDQPGEYLLSASYPPGSEGPDAVLAVGQVFFSNLLFEILSVLALIFGSLLAGGIIIILTFIKRRDASRRAAKEERLIRGGRN
ncbi:MAG: hypothetical protein HPY61_05690 [Methanotrichaceae archaeon]|nr:hypothetical protein [Methanotrichaceae archaeon]